jgi:hypothetical protein
MGSVAATLPKGGFPLKDQHAVGRSAEELRTLPINIQVRRQVTLWMIFDLFKIFKQVNRQRASLFVGNVSKCFENHHVFKESQSPAPSDKNSEEL